MYNQKWWNVYQLVRFVLQILFLKIKPTDFQINLKTNFVDKSIHPYFFIITLFC